MSKDLKIAVIGELTDVSAAEQKRRVLDQIGPEVGHLELDLSGVTAVDGRGVNVLLEVYREVRQRRGSLNLVGVPDNVKQAVAQEQLDDVLPIEVRTEQSQFERQPEKKTGRPNWQDRQTEEAGPPRRGSNVGWWLAGILVVGLLYVMEQVMFSGPAIAPPTSEDKGRFSVGNARMVGSLLQEYGRKHKRYPTRPEDVQALINERNLSLVNLYTGEPLAVVADGTNTPGVLTYKVVHGHFRLQALGADGQPLPGADGKPLVVSDTAAR